MQLFSTSRIQKMEVDNMEMSREWESTCTFFRQLEHGLEACGCGDKARTTSECPVLPEDRVVRNITSVATDLSRILADTTYQ